MYHGQTPFFTHWDFLLSDLCLTGFLKFLDCIYRLVNVPISLLVLLSQPVTWIRKASHDNNCCLLNSYYVPCTEKTLCMCYLVIFPLKLWDGSCYYPHFTDAKTSAHTSHTGRTSILTWAISDPKLLGLTNILYCLQSLPGPTLPIPHGHSAVVFPCYYW